MPPVDFPIEHFRAWLHLSPECAGELTPYRDWLRERGVLAVIRLLEQSVPRQYEMDFLMGPEGGAVFVREGGVAAEEPLEGLLAAMVHDLGGYVETQSGLRAGDESAEVTSADWEALEGGESLKSEQPSEEPAGRSVLIGRFATDQLPMLAREAGTSLRGTRVDGWTVVVFDDVVDDGSHVWLADDLPGLWLQPSLGRSVWVHSTRGLRPQLVLSRPAEVTLVFTEAELPAFAIAMVREWFGDPDEFAELGELHGLEAFRDVDLNALRAALAAPSDECWFGQVLAALGVPQVAADLFEGRATLPASTTVTPKSLRGVLMDSLRHYEKASNEEVAERGALGRLYGTSARTPWVALTTIVPEILIGVAVLVVLAGLDDSAWWHWLAGLFAVLCLFDAVLDSALLVVRLRRKASVRGPDSR